MTERFSKEMLERPSPLELGAFLPWACSQLLAPFDVRVVVQLQDEYVSKTDDKSKKSKSAKSTIQHTSRTFESPQKREESASAAGVGPLLVDDEPDAVIALAAVCDPSGRLVELAFSRAPAVPRLLLKVIALCVPFHPSLARLTVRWGPLEGAALYEIANLLPLSQITEVCLDDSPVPECNYHLLLDAPSQLRGLSLARCSLDDRDCASLAARLHYPLPAARSLLTLSLAANRIADAGAAALADALRSNRTLQYLNLSGNRITDEGAGRLFESLMEFPLTHEELVTKRRRLFDHLRLKDELFRKCYAELAAAERALDELGRGKRRQTAAGRGRKPSVERRATSAGDQLAARAQAAAAELAGAHADPFGGDETVARDSYVHAVGNTALVALNLAYNSLGYASALKLLAVLRHQAALARRPGPGLLRALLEGNALPAGGGGALAQADELLDRALAWRVAKPLKSKTERAAGKAKSK